MGKAPQKSKPRTGQQNRALHLYLTHVAHALNDGGLSIQEVLQKTTMEIEWTPASVKEILWRTAQKRLLGKTSTKDLRKQEDIDKVWEVLNRFLAKLGVEHIPFPSALSMEAQMKGYIPNVGPRNFTESRV